MAKSDKSYTYMAYMYKIFLFKFFRVRKKRLVVLVLVQI